MSYPTFIFWVRNPTSRLVAFKPNHQLDGCTKNLHMNFHTTVAGMSRVDVHATISDRWRALRVKLDAARRFRSSLPRFRSPKAKPEAHLIDGPSMSPSLDPFSVSACSSFPLFVVVLVLLWRGSRL
jgi:hypothetical protein